MGLSGKVAIVTGASRGIGEAIAATLAKQGATLALVARSRADLEQVAARIAAAGGQRTDFSLRPAASGRGQALVAAIGAQLGHIDILVNNAGATPHGHLLQRGRYRMARCLRGEDPQFRAHVPRLLAASQNVARPDREYLRRAGAMRRIPAR